LGFFCGQSKILFFIHFVFFKIALKNKKIKILRDQTPQIQNIVRQEIMEIVIAAVKLE